MTAKPLHHLAAAHRVLVHISLYEGTKAADAISSVSSDVTDQWILQLLVEAGFITPLIGNREIFPYRITWKGLQFLEFYNLLENVDRLPCEEQIDEVNSRLFSFF